MKFSRSPLTVVLSLLVLAGCAAPPPADLHDASVQAIKDTEAAWAKAGASKNMDQFLSFYSDDVAVLIPGVPTLNGKEAVRGAMKPMFDDPNFSITFAATRADASKSGELGYTQGAYTMVTSDPNTKAPMTDKGKYLTVFKKMADGNWKAVEDTFNSDAPPPRFQVADAAL